MRFLIPTILLILSVASFVVFTNPAYEEVKTLKAQAAQYDTALTNSRKLQEQRDALGVKYRSISPDELARLSKLLPDNADNIRLIIDIQQMAQSYGMTLAAIKFDAGQTTAAASASGPLSSATSTDVAAASRDYGAFDLAFSTTATYENFLKFLKDIESSLRLTDIQSIDFSAGDPAKGTTTFTVKLRTYWLKG
jgi:Tfp pilus assembly protein PilO